MEGKLDSKFLSEDTAVKVQNRTSPFSSIPPTYTAARTSMVDRMQLSSFSLALLPPPPPPEQPVNKCHIAAAPYRGRKVEHVLLSNQTPRQLHRSAWGGHGTGGDGRG
ncbi:hypothetical protein E2C01_045969 [Portunus trituberculatus]|uniref:Uncharacterized protein n=1 Tax=Portunus trituberculatus TaxID=210409 RepID=A0A5B7G4I9_PORTR|nr:hypothetical protein [Portunus trituberculatus]